MLKAANQQLARRYPGDATGRQPVHTFIAPADAFTADSAQRAGQQALEILATFASTPQSLAQIVGLPATPLDDRPQRSAVTYASIGLRSHSGRGR